jgi:hypothetical protein
MLILGEDVHLFQRGSIFGLSFSKSFCDGAGSKCLHEASFLALARIRWVGTDDFVDLSYLLCVLLQYLDEICA